MAKKKKKRLKCRACGAKSLRLLNIKQQIYECIRESCQKKWLYIPQENTFILLKDADIQMVKQTVKEPVIEQTENVIENKPTHVEESNDPLMNMAKELGF